MMVAISLTKLRVSRVEVDWERSWDSLALRQGWDEMWTFLGREDIMMETDRSVARRRVVEEGKYGSRRGEV